MRRIYAIGLLGLAVILVGCGHGGHIRRQWVQPDEEMGNQKGVGFYHDFTLEGLKGQQCYIEVRLADRAGHALLSEDGHYQTPDSGQVSARRAVTCVRSRLEGRNLRVFIPYDQLELPPGRHPLVVESRLVTVRDQKVLDMRRRRVALPIPTELARASRVRRPPARPTGDPRMGVATPVKEAPRGMASAHRTEPRPATPVRVPKPKIARPVEPPKPQIHWFVKRRQGGTLRGPFASRAAGEAALSRHPGRLVAKAPTDKVWLSTCFDIEKGSREVRVIGPFDNRESAAQARESVRHQSAHLGWAFSEVTAIPVDTFVKDYARRAR